jgi:hypothetical protein
MANEFDAVEFAPEFYSDGFHTFTPSELRASYKAEFPEESEKSISQAIEHAIYCGAIFAL